MRGNMSLRLRGDNMKKRDDMYSKAAFAPSGQTFRGKSENASSHPIPEI